MSEHLPPRDFPDGPQSLNARTIKHLATLEVIKAKSTLPARTAWVGKYHARRHRLILPI
jgi:hypothetical protein